MEHLDIKLSKEKLYLKLPYLWIVSVGVSVIDGADVELLHEVQAEHQGEPLIVGDVLNETHLVRHQINKHSLALVRGYLNIMTMIFK